MSLSLEKAVTRDVRASHRNTDHLILTLSFSTNDRLGIGALGTLTIDYEGKSVGNPLIRHSAFLHCRW